MYVLVFAVVFVGAWLVSALSAMLGINMVHNHYWNFIPTITYGSAMAITFFPLLFATLWATLVRAIKGD